MGHPPRPTGSSPTSRLPASRPLWVGATAPVELLTELGCVPTTVKDLWVQSQLASLRVPSSLSLSLHWEVWPPVALGAVAQEAGENGRGKQAAYGP